MCLACHMARALSREAMTIFFGVVFMQEGLSVVVLLILTYCDGLACEKGSVCIERIA